MQNLRNMPNAPAKYFSNLPSVHKKYLTKTPSAPAKYNRNMPRALANMPSVTNKISQKHAVCIFKTSKHKCILDNR
jgi:hypothetical protein